MYQFVIIDDDSLNNKICKALIETVVDNAEILTFTDPVAAFKHVATQYNDAPAHLHPIVLLDINMQAMDAWEFLLHFDLMHEKVKKRIHMYILSSSVNMDDMNRAKRDRNVKSYLIKPLSREVINAVIATMDAASAN